MSARIILLMLDLRTGQVMSFTPAYGETHLGEDRTNNNASGLSEEDIDRCLKKKILCPDILDNKGDEEEETEVCAICLDGMCHQKDKTGVGILGCGHEYHVCCIKRWLRVKNFCPLCKAVAMRTSACN
ncbi:PREDICTED: probable E3 ubiquitin-protein ligase HIP1 [Erythranthe guttata]|nr:PREDICTED: probable E3 ubiquitin-protein ligase HIP1 [Erythranthe guttata]|eukprot:XP_012850963.1 PREDICTED: probable E3 ubiquitin-protein ligase HIP1 [Erythranthe guttata]